MVLHYLQVTSNEYNDPDDEEQIDNSWFWDMLVEDNDE